MGLGIIRWNVDPRNWETQDTAATVEHVLANAEDGNVIMHDIYDASARAAEILIPELVNQGYELVTVSEAAAVRGGIKPGRISYALINSKKGKCCVNSKALIYRITPCYLWS